MKKLLFLLAVAFSLVFVNCKKAAPKEDPTTTPPPTADFVWSPEKFSDKKIIRYQVSGFENLTLKQKQLVYYLTQAGLSGRDIIWDQHYRHNLVIRRALERILENYKPAQPDEQWDKFQIYCKNVFFSNGIHHHYSSDKFIPEFSKEYFQNLLTAVKHTLNDEVINAMFDPNVDAKRTNFDESKGVIASSAVNTYDRNITDAEVDAFYKAMAKKGDTEPLEYGLNSKLVKVNGKLQERPYKVGGMYGEALNEVVKWLKKAVEVAENQKQADALKLLIEYYQTGDLAKWRDYNIAWLNATEGDIDYINGFIEVYHDPKARRGAYETIVQIKDFDASARMEKVASNAQWFEDNSTIMPEHKKKEVTGISYKVVIVAGEAGDASPSTAIGVNLPNSDWIRATHGSKSVSLGNITEAYEKADGPGLLQEFANDPEEIERAKKHASLAGKMHTALHEVIGHASGQIEPGKGQPGETLKTYASPLEEARADLVALYFIMDPKMVELGLMESDEVAKAEYDSYLKNGLMLQLRRIKPGKNIEQAHMRNRQMVSKWVFEKAQKDGSIVKEVRDGKTYIDIKDYQKVRGHFGDLLREVQRIKSQGDYKAGKNLIENYGVIVDKELHAEVLRRSEPLNIPPYGGFINPRYVPVTNDKSEIIDIRIEYPDDFIGQMLEYGQKYSFLPNEN